MGFHRHPSLLEIFESLPIDVLSERMRTNRSCNLLPSYHVGREGAKVVIFSVQLLLASSGARCKAMRQRVPAYPVPLRRTRCMAQGSKYGLRAHVDKSARSCGRVWTHLQLRWSEHQRAMSIASRETNPTQRRIGILLAQCCPVTTDPIKHSTYNQKAIEKSKG